jgi:hypothetical protein
MRYQRAIGFLLVVVGLVLAIFGFNEFLDIDSCLDRGGGWDYAERRCSFDDGPSGVPNNYDVWASLFGAVLAVAGLINLRARGAEKSELNT